MERLIKIMLGVFGALLMVVLVINLLAIYDRDDITTGTSINNLIVSIRNTIFEEVAKEMAENTDEGGEIILPLLSQEKFEEYFEGEIEISRMPIVSEDGFVQITKPRSILSTDTNEPEELVKKQLETFKSLGIEVVEAYSNEDASATFVLTESDYELYVGTMEDVFNGRLSSLEHNVSVNKEFNKLYIYVNEESTLLDFSMDQYTMIWHMIGCQICSGIPHDEWYIDLYVINTSANEIILETRFTEEDYGFAMTSEEWEQLFE